jgi:Glyoxalase-like domain
VRQPGKSQGRLAATSSSSAPWQVRRQYVDEPPPSPFATREEWLKQFHLSEDDAEDGAWLCDPAGAGPRLFLQQVPEPKAVKNRLHMDVRVAGQVSADERWAVITGTVGRLAAAGATVLREVGEHHVVMADPEGHEFCVC